ncbi:MAG: hypothetical protein NVS2B3_12560 [Vulcanimicrobiaceae bacterium]
MTAFVNYRLFALAGSIAALAACSSGATVLKPGPVPTPTPSPTPTAAPLGSLGAFTSLTTIGSTVDPGPGPGAGDQNPYGLTIATATAGKEVAGNLMICNFNDAANVQGNGTTIEQLAPTPGSAPTRFIQDPALKGCNALAMAPNGNVWAADYIANNNPIISPAGTINTTLSQNTWYGPWGQAFNGGTASMPTFFETNAKNGTVTRIHINPGPSFTFDTILTGLSYNNGAPGNILAPAGLTYEKASDSLYVVDSNANRVLKIAAATTAPANTYATTGATFNTPNVSVVYSGAPLNAPISSAMLANGNLVVGNTGDNTLVEIVPSSGSVFSTKLVDTGAAGAIFGIAATAASGTQYVYFNDDNTNTVVRLSP